MADGMPEGSRGGPPNPIYPAAGGSQHASPLSLSGIPTKQSASQNLQQPSEDSLGMSTLAAALPADSSSAFLAGQRYHMNEHAAMRHMPQYGTQSGQAQMQPYAGYPQTHVQGGAAVPYPPYPEQQNMGAPYSPLQAQYAGSNIYGSPQPSPQYGGFPPGYGMQSHSQAGGYPGPSRVYPGHEYAQINNPVIPMMSPGARAMYPPQTGRTTASSGASSIPSAPRGPPRKPKQSGHALWVGNLPPGTQVNDLKDHFSRDATKDIESVFLISKSNCAFVNYKTEATCAAAMTRFHDSRFQGVRLVCRLRKGPGSISSPSGPSSPAPSGPAALQSGSTQSQSAVDAISQNRESSARAMEAAVPGEVPVNDKYFVVKSLTIEDLELSARNGIWATQGHNEEALNRAYETVENVYLIFSANKSGEYFGYARMESPINDESAKDLEWKPFGETRAAEAAADPELPRSIPTLATETAPKGRIIDDSARGTIFWEADSEEDESANANTLESPDPDQIEGDKEEDESSDAGIDEASRDILDGVPGSGEAGTQTFGRPFRVRWISTAKLPFYRTRGLRNPWNANREVKIARDGTELETSVGRRLVAMFHRAPTPQQLQAVHMQGQQAFMGQLPPNMGYGMPPMSPGGRY